MYVWLSVSVISKSAPWICVMDPKLLVACMLLYTVRTFFSPSLSICSAVIGLL